MTETDIILIDFMWGLHHYAQGGFPALQLLHEIKHLGRRYKVPTLKKAPKGDGIAEVRWFEVGAFDKDVPTDCLRSYAAEMWNRYRHPDRPVTYIESNGKRVFWHEEGDTLQVNAEKAVEMIDRYCTSTFGILSRSETALETTRFLMNEGIVIIPTGMIGRYQYMAQRAQYFTHLYEKPNLTPAELDEYLPNNSITNAEHVALVGESSLAEDEQLSLFEL
jgi:DNA sulfur modification protein DndC